MSTTSTAQSSRFVLIRNKRLVARAIFMWCFSCTALYIISKNRMAIAAPKPNSKSIKAGRTSTRPMLLKPMPPSHGGFRGSQRRCIRFKIPVSRIHWSLQKYDVISIFERILNVTSRLPLPKQLFIRTISFNQKCSDWQLKRL